MQDVPKGAKCLSVRTWWGKAQDRKTYVLGFVASIRTHSPDQRSSVICKVTRLPWARELLISQLPMTPLISNSRRRIVLICQWLNYPQTLPDTAARLAGASMFENGTYILDLQEYSVSFMHNLS